MNNHAVANSSEATGSPQKLDPAFIPDSPSSSPGCFKRRRMWCFCGICGISTLLIVGIILIVFFEAALPKITQTVIDHAYLELEDVVISNPSERAFGLAVNAVLVRDRKIPATMHDTELSVYVNGEPHATAAEKPDSGKVFRRMQAEAESEAEASNEVFLGILRVPELYMSGYRTPMQMDQIFEFSSLEAFDAFSTSLIRDGKSSWHVKGTTVVTVLGKTVTKLNFDKLLEISGPSFMAPPAVSKTADLPQVVLPKITGISAEPRPDGALDVSVNMTVTNPGGTVMDPLGAVLFELSWNDLILGELETDVISVFPGKNEVELWGIWDLNDNLRGLSLFEMIKVAKLLNELRVMGQNGETVTMNAVGLACSIPLYDAAVRAIDASFTIEHFSLDLMGHAEEDEGEEEDSQEEVAAPPPPSPVRAEPATKVAEAVPIGDTNLDTEGYDSETDEPVIETEQGEIVEDEEPMIEAVYSSPEAATDDFLVEEPEAATDDFFVEEPDSANDAMQDVAVDSGSEVAPVLADSETSDIVTSDEPEVVTEAETPPLPVREDAEVEAEVLGDTGIEIEPVVEAEDIVE